MSADASDPLDPTGSAAEAPVSEPAVVPNAAVPEAPGGPDSADVAAAPGGPSDAAPDRAGGGDAERLAARVAALESLLAAVQADLGRLRRAVEEANQLERKREVIVDRLHAENQTLRTGELRSALLPMIRSFIGLHDDLARSARSVAERPAGDTAELAALLESYRESIADILYRHEVERYEAAAGQPFDPREQRAVGAVPTGDAALDRNIARMVRPGFRIEQRVVRALEAEVFRYDAALAAPLATPEPDPEPEAEPAASAAAPPEPGAPAPPAPAVP
jgi:molecular chaperone GrpE (heat shock protein)